MAKKEEWKEPKFNKEQIKALMAGWNNIVEKPTKKSSTNKTTKKKSGK